MDNALRDTLFWNLFTIFQVVLILVVMDNALRAKQEKLKTVFFIGLNPCFNGKCSQSFSGGLKIEFGIYLS